MAVKSPLSRDKDDRIPPPERPHAVAADLCYRHGIKAVGGEAITEAAGTNKMNLYSHCASKNELVAESLRPPTTDGHRPGYDPSAFGEGVTISGVAARSRDRDQTACSVDRRPKGRADHRRCEGFARSSLHRCADRRALR